MNDDKSIRYAKGLCKPLYADFRKKFTTPDDSLVMICENVDVYLCACDNPTETSTCGSDRSFIHNCLSEKMTENCYRNKTCGVDSAKLPVKKIVKVVKPPKTPRKVVRKPVVVVDQTHVVPPTVVAPPPIIIPPPIVVEPLVVVEQPVVAQQPVVTQPPPLVDPYQPTLDPAAIHWAVGVQLAGNPLHRSFVAEGSTGAPAEYTEFMLGVSFVHNWYIARQNPNLSFDLQAGVKAVVGFGLPQSHDIEAGKYTTVEGGPTGRIIWTAIHTDLPLDIYGNLVFVVGSLWTRDLIEVGSDSAWYQAEPHQKMQWSFEATAGIGTHFDYDTMRLQLFFGSGLRVARYNDSFSDAQNTSINGNQLSVPVEGSFDLEF